MFCLPEVSTSSSIKALFPDKLMGCQDDLPKWFDYLKECSSYKKFRSNVENNVNETLGLYTSSWILPLGASKYYFIITLKT